MLSFRIRRLCAPHYINYSFVTRGALIDLARAFILPRKLLTASLSVLPAFLSLAGSLCRRHVHIPPLLDGPRSIEFKIQISVEIPSSKTPWLPSPLHDLSFSLDHSLLPRSSSTHCSIPPFVSFSLWSFPLAFLFPSCAFLYQLFCLCRTHSRSSLLRLLVRKVVIGPSATSDRGGKQPRERTPDSGKGLGVVRG